jgi:hypothetical protein
MKKSAQLHRGGQLAGRTLHSRPLKLQRNHTSPGSTGHAGMEPETDSNGAQPFKQLKISWTANSELAEFQLDPLNNVQEFPSYDIVAKFE